MARTTCHHNNAALHDFSNGKHVDRTAQQTRESRGKWWCRQNQELESMFYEEKVRLEAEAQALAQQLQAVLSDKFSPQTDFDADTPIDKTLKILQTVIGVGSSIAVHLSAAAEPLH